MTQNNYLSLTTFVPGTKAKADEVNSNFTVLKNAILEKASQEGDSSQSFYVADATDAKHAVNKEQLDETKEELENSLAKLGYRFCIRKGNTTGGDGDLFEVSLSNLVVTPKIGGAYSNLVISDYTGAVHTIRTADNFTMQGKSDGEYNVFANADGEIYVLKNKVYTQKSRPELIDGDIWLDTSCEPLYCIKYTNNTDEEFLDVPIGKITMTNGVISEIKTLPFVSNGYDVTYNNFPEYKYDYGKPISRSFGVTYTAETDGLLYVRGSNTNTHCMAVLDGYGYTIHISSSQGSVAGGFIPVSKNQTYSVAYGTQLLFVPKVKY